MSTRYKGRFAPTPSGPAHLGSMLAALGSFLHARQQGGIWHVRIDDIDPPREVPGSADGILRSLERFGLWWDDEVIYQSQRHASYKDALQSLRQNNKIYPCSCSRRQIADIGQSGPNGIIYPGTCRQGIHGDAGQTSLRLITQDTTITLNDMVQSEYSLNILRDVGDFVVRRADGLFSYHLATVVDDADYGYTHIVRGRDQLSLTPQHIYLQQQLGKPTPDYAHLPLLTTASGEKLAKSSHARAVDDYAQEEAWAILLDCLGLRPDPALYREAPEVILDWCLIHWRLSLMKPDDKIVE